MKEMSESLQVNIGIQKVHESMINLVKQQQGNIPLNIEKPCTTIDKVHTINSH